MRRNLETAGTNLSQTFANQNAFNMNQAAREQYLAGLSAAQNAAAQASANAYLNFGGQLGSGIIGAYSQRRTPSNPSLDALYRTRGGWGNTQGYTAYA